MRLDDLEPFACVRNAHPGFVRCGMLAALTLVALVGIAPGVARADGNLYGTPPTDSAELPDAPAFMETVGSDSVPMLDGKPLHPRTHDTSAGESDDEHHAAQNMKGPSFFSRLGSGTKRFFSGLGNLFAVRKTDTRTRFVGQTPNWQQPSPPKDKKGSWFGGLFSGSSKDQKAEEPATPQEWLAQPRPKMF